MSDIKACKTEQGGRDGKGRFVKGCRGGPGNPRSATVAAFRVAFLNAITDGEIRAVARMLVKTALGGEPWAIKELLNRCLGKPPEDEASATGGVFKLTLHPDDAGTDADETSGA